MEPCSITEGKLMNHHNHSLISFSPVIKFADFLDADNQVEFQILITPTAGKPVAQRQHKIWGYSVDDTIA